MMQRITRVCQRQLILVYVWFTRAQPLGGGRTTPTFLMKSDYRYVTACSAQNWIYHPHFVLYNNLDQEIGPPTLKTWLRPWWFNINTVMCHCQQLAVPCYPEYVVDDINKQISALKSEYHAFVNKLQSLEPDHAITDHRYRSQLKRTSDGKYSLLNVSISIFWFLLSIFINISICLYYRIVFSFLQ